MPLAAYYAERERRQSGEDVKRSNTIDLSILHHRKIAFFRNGRTKGNVKLSQSEIAATKFPFVFFGGRGLGKHG